MRGIPVASWAFSLLGILLLPWAASGQGFQTLADRCGEGAGGYSVRCHVAALALDAARGGLATAAAMGPEIPASASTIGYRLRSSPRFALSTRAGVTRFAMPDILEGFSPSPGDKNLTLPTVQLSGVLGVLNGFSPMPTVGGVFSLDVTASAQHVFAVGNDNLQAGVSGWGLGLRLGLLRESFTLPGISLSVSRRWMDSAEIGQDDPGVPARLAFEDEITSVRAVVGKDLLGFGLFGGAGWDRIQGEGTIRVRLAPSASEVTATVKNLRSERLTYFAGASRTFLILQLSGEVGFSESRDPELPVDPGGDKYPSARAVYGSLALRVTF